MAYGDYQDAYGSGGYGGDQTQAPPPGYHWDETQGIFVPDRTGFPTPSTGLYNPNPPQTQFGNDAIVPPVAPPPAAAPNLGGGALAPYTAPPPAFPTIPGFTPPPAYVAGQFKAPSVADALNDPGQQFRTQQGEAGLMRSAAARGLGNDSGTLKALLDYGQNAGEAGYGNVYARDFNTFQANEGARANAYKTNYGTQYVDPYQINRQTQYIDPWTAAYNTWKQQGDFYLGNQGNVVGGTLGFGQLLSGL